MPRAAATPRAAGRAVASRCRFRASQVKTLSTQVAQGGRCAQRAGRLHSLQPHLVSTSSGLALASGGRNVRHRLRSVRRCPYHHQRRRRCINHQQCLRLTTSRGRVATPAEPGPAPTGSIPGFTARSCRNRAARLARAAVCRIRRILRLHHDGRRLKNRRRRHHRHWS